MAGSLTLEEAIGRIDWSIYHDAPFPEQLPQGSWATNKEGNYYLSVFDDDGTYWYFNLDGGWYVKRRPRANDYAAGAATYLTPSGEVIYRPADGDRNNPNCSYFVGIDWNTRREHIYFDDGSRNIVRTFRKDLKSEKIHRRAFVFTLMGCRSKPPSFYVREDGNYHDSDPEVIKALESARFRAEDARRKIGFIYPHKIPLSMSPQENPRKDLV